MAIAKPNRETKTCDIVTTAIPEQYDTITQSERVTPLDIQVACTEGSPWTVTYYRQRLRAHNEQRYSDTELSPSFQSYVRIKNLVLRVTAPLNADVVDGINKSSGTAIVTGIVPIVGDAFVGAMMAGVYYVFNVTSVTPLTFLNTTAFSIEYEMVCEANTSSPRIQDLTNKTFKTMVWDGTLGSCGQPLVGEGTAELRKELLNMIVRLMDEYMRLFLDADTDLFILEEEGLKLYDNHLTIFILHTWPLEKTVLGKRIRGISPIESERIYDTLWDELVQQSDVLFNVKQKLGMIRTNYYDRNMSRINTMAHRTNYIVGHDDESIHGTDAINSVYVDPAVLIPEVSFKDITSPMYGMITDDDYYVLTEHYYNRSGGPVIDRMAQAFLQGESVSEESIITLVRNWKEWPMANKYWQTPLLVLLMRYVLEGKKGESLEGAASPPCENNY